jgi:hypothetical protein
MCLKPSKLGWPVLALMLAVGNLGCHDGADSSAEPSPDHPTGDYVGQAPPGAEPRLFAPDFVSTGLYERDVAMTPAGDELYFGLLGSGYAAVAVTKRVDEVWTPPELAAFSRDPNVRDLEAHITPDGARLLFLSTRPGEGKDYAPGWTNQDIWAVDRVADGWGEPYNLGPPVNSDAPEFFPSTTRDGTLYFTREVDQDGRHRSLVYRARFEDGRYLEPECLPEAVNAGDEQFNACVDPDERFLVFGMTGRVDAIGRADYYVTFRSEGDTWIGPINLGEPVNTPDNTVVSPSFSPDGRYFFFASTRKIRADGGSPTRSYQEIQRMQAHPGNGNSDIYWIDAAVIEALRPAPTMEAR